MYFNTTLYHGLLPKFGSVKTRVENNNYYQIKNMNSKWVLQINPIEENIKFELFLFRVVIYRFES